MQNPLTITIFGATGDLFQNKLIRALFYLFQENYLPSDFTIIGFARRPLGEDGFREFSRDAVLKKDSNADVARLNEFLAHLKYEVGNLDDLQSFKNLSKTLGLHDNERGRCSNKLFYLAVPPTLYGAIFQNVSLAGLDIPCAQGLETAEKNWARILVEKPFGKDLIEAEHLDKMLGELFDESQIFRIDHYLAKEAASRILDFRFSNEELEKKWNKDNVEKIRILFHEEGDVSKRGDFYDGLGALRDVGQNHMLEMLALVAMEKPKEGDVKDIHQKRFEVLDAIRLSSASVRGQYDGYLEEPNVNPNSDTETFFRVMLKIESPRWQGVTFELESGKALSQYEVLIEVYFKNSSKRYIFTLSGEEANQRDAYEKVLEGAILGDQSSFVSTEEVMVEWKIIDDIIAKWQSTPLIIYKKGASAEIIK